MGQSNKHFLKTKGIFALLFITVFCLFLVSFVQSMQNTRSRAQEGKPALQMQVWKITLAPTSIPLPSSTPVRPSAAPSISSAPSRPSASGTSSAPPAAPQPQVASTNCGSQSIQQLVNSVSESELRKNLQELVDNKGTQAVDQKNSRHVSAKGNAVATAYIKNYFESIGVSSYYQPYTVKSYKLNNTIGRIQGKTANEYYVLGGHMDSISPSRTVAPGADDDGSGVVLLMEAARVLRAFQPCLKTSIEFAAFNGEEIGLTGSTQYVKTRGSKKIRGMLNSDMVANSSGSDCVSFGYKAYNGGDVLARKLAEVSKKYGINLNGKMKQSSQGNSDHGPFWDAGLPAIFVFECSFSPVYHKENDNLNYISFSQLTKTTKAVVAAVAELASQ